MLSYTLTFEKKRKRKEVQDVKGIAKHLYTLEVFKRFVKM